MVKKGCLVVHGLTGTPANMESLTEPLKAKGYLVKVPLLKGHGGDLQTLSQMKWEDWYFSVHRAYEEISKEAKDIYYAGLSLGAILGLKLAINTGNSLKGLALLGLPFEVKPLFRYLIIPAVRYTPLRFFITSVAKNFEKSVLDPEGRKYYRAHSIARMPSSGVFETQNLVRSIKKDLPKITQPLLLIHAHKDHLADPHALLDLKRWVSSKRVDIVMMENSGHVITCDYDREKAAQRVVQFFESFPQ